MLAHGRIDAAFDFVVHCDVPFGFPFGYTANLMQKLDDERRLIVLRRAMEAWRAPQDSELMRKHGIPFEADQAWLIRNGHLQRHFISLFRYRWTLLPPEEALAVVREIVRIALDGPDQGTSVRYPDVHITSSSEHVLFEVLHILRHLDLPLADSLFASHSQLAAAAQRYPNGTETMHRELELIPSARLCVAGDGPDLPQMKELAAQLGIEQNVLFVGQVMRSQTPDFYRAHAIYVLPSLGELYATSLLEAMSCGRPIVITDAGGSPALVPASGGLRVPLKDAPALAAAILHLLQHPKDRRIMAVANRIHVLRSMTWPNITGTREGYYSELVPTVRSQNRKL
jgi:hypothetical protein